MTFAGGSWSEALERCERRDPVGHAIHLGVGVLFMALLPIGTAPAIILSVPLLVISLLRLPVTASLLPHLLRWAPAPPALLLAAWLALSLLWSADPKQGAHLLASMRVLLVPLLLAPLLRRRALLAGALLAGITLQAVVQGAQYALHRGAWNFDGLERFGGFTSDPGKAGLWDAIGVCGGVVLALVPGWRAARSPLPSTIPAMPIMGVVIAGVLLVGTIASGTRRQLAALAVVVPLLLAWTIVVMPHRRRRALLIVVTGAVAVGAAWPFMGPSIMTRARQTLAQLRAPAADHEDPSAPPMRGIVHYDLRGYYWAAALEGWRAHPIRGLGLGGAAKSIAESSRRDEVEPWLRAEMRREYPDRSPDDIERDLRGRLESNHPHSTWLQLLAEGGIIGFALGFAAWALAWIAALRRALAADERDPVPLACAAALLLWGLGAIFDASINSTSLSAAMVLATLGGLPPRRTTRPAAP